MNKKITYSILFVSLFSLPVLALAQATIPNPIKYDNFGKLLTDGIIPAVSLLIGSLATIMIIIAGILYLTSAGSPERIGTAKKALTYAIVGIVIALAASGIAATIKKAIGG